MSAVYDTGEVCGKVVDGGGGKVGDAKLIEAGVLTVMGLAATLVDVLDIMGEGWKEDGNCGCVEKVGID